MAVPANMKALLSEEGKTAKERTIPVPKVGEDEILVKVTAVTLNPTDWKHMRNRSSPGLILGCDFAGRVAKASSNGVNVKKGEKVAGFVFGGKFTDEGSFAEYLKIDPTLVVTIPEHVKVEKAASIGIGGYTAVQALFQRLQLHLPSQTDIKLPEITSGSPQVLIWSGATSVGQWAIQLARAAGYFVITTASPKNTAFLKSIGAAKVYNYQDDSVPEEISSNYPLLSSALDCYSENGSQSKVARALGKNGGKMVVLLDPEREAFELRKNVQIIPTLIYSALGRPFSWGETVFSEEQVTKDRDFIRIFANGDKGIFYHLLKNDLITGNQVRVFAEHDLQQILQGLEYLEQGSVSAEKLAFRF